VITSDRPDNERANIQMEPTPHTLSCDRIAEARDSFGALGGQVRGPDVGS